MSKPHPTVAELKRIFQFLNIDELTVLECIAEGNGEWVTVNAIRTELDASLDVMTGMMGCIPTLEQVARLMYDAGPFIERDPKRSKFAKARWRRIGPEGIDWEDCFNVPPRQRVGAQRILENARAGS